MALLEILGVGSVIPFISVLSQPELIKTNEFLAYIYSYLNFSNIEQFTVFLGFTFFVFFFLSICFKSFTLYAQLRFVLSHEYIIGRKLMEGYFNQPYIWFLNKNASDISKNILFEVSEVIGNGMVPLMNIISQCAVVIALISLLLIVNPIVALRMIFILFSSYLIIFISVNNLLSKTGRKKLLANQQRFRIVDQSFSAIKEIKVLNASEHYIKRFSNEASNYWKFNASSQLIAALPRFALEALSFGVLLLFILVEYYRGISLSENLPIISVYAISGYRLLPAFQQIYVAFSKLRYVKHTLNLIHSEMKDLKFPEKRKLDTNKWKLITSLKLENISFNYPDSKIKSLDKVSIEIKKNQIVGITGRSGSGKSTLIDIILGIISPKSGNIYLNNKKINTKEKISFMQSIGYVPQDIYLADDTVAANIALGIDKEEIKQKQLEKVAKIANIHDFVIGDLTQGYETIIGDKGIKLSGGQKQRIGLARALYRNPNLLILDEGTSALDNITEKLIINSIKKLSSEITIIFVAHRLNSLKICDEIYLLEKSKLINSGTYQELLENSSEFFNLHNLSNNN